MSDANEAFARWLKAGRPDSTKDMPDGLAEYWAANGRYTGSVWQVSFREEPAYTSAEACTCDDSHRETPSLEEMEKVQQAAAATMNRMLDEMTAAMFYGRPAGNAPVPTVCQGNQHVFKMGADYCQCGKVKND